VQNRELSVQLTKAREDLVQAKSGATDGAGALTYTHKKAQAKADAEATAEIAKYKRLYTGGAERLGRLQQENEKLNKVVSTLQASQKELQAKVALLEDQLKSYRSSVRLAFLACH
jgi:predicted RNase H-like nuclease (RuvC/YqgF family)